ncbi:MAG: DUF1028 domain-containing protein [Planctomycetota bacterium]|nr:DUF1028 domain-containing protein [Planctomycetota bacterium]
MHKRFLALLFAVLVLADVARATWSIVVVNHKTGEVCVASATCIGGFDLKPALCVIRVGEGGAAAQSVIDPTGLNRLTIWNELQNGTPPNAILAQLAAQDTLHQRRQYGIVSLRGGPATFTGSQCGQARFGVSGTTGDLSYAIQGNILTGNIVVTNAEAAFLASSGDLPTRVMAAMIAARDMGGDGRCSCSQMQPTSCGAPPPGFTYSAATAFIVSSRLGDTDGVCNSGQGCANGQYWCDVRVIDGPPTGQDPVVRMANQAIPFWRASLGGRADHFLTRVTKSAERIPADGLTTVTVDVELRNIDDQGIDPFAPQLLVTSVDSPAVAIASASTDLGQGRLRFTLTSTGVVGRGRFLITVTQGDQSRVRLWPALEIEAVPAAPLVCGYETVSASAGGSIPLWLDLSAARAASSYLVLGTTSGTVPGIPFQGVQLPLNRDRFLNATFLHTAGGPFQGTAGALDGMGRAVATFVPPAGYLAPLIGRRIDWAAYIGGTPATVTNVAGFDVAP